MTTAGIPIVAECIAAANRSLRDAEWRIFGCIWHATFLWGLISKMSKNWTNLEELARLREAFTDEDSSLVLSPDKGVHPGVMAEGNALSRHWSSCDVALGGVAREETGQRIMDLLLVAVEIVNAIVEITKSSDHGLKEGHDREYEELETVEIQLEDHCGPGV